MTTDASGTLAGLDPPDDEPAPVRHGVSCASQRAPRPLTIAGLPLDADGRVDEARCQRRIDAACRRIVADIGADGALQAAARRWLAGRL